MLFYGYEHIESLKTPEVNFAWLYETDSNAIR